MKTIPYSIHIEKNNQEQYFDYPKNLKNHNINRTALLEQMRTIDKSRLIRKIGELTQLEMERINKCIRISLGV